MGGRKIQKGGERAWERGQGAMEGERGSGGGFYRRRGGVLLEAPCYLEGRGLPSIEKARAF